MIASPKDLAAPPLFCLLYYYYLGMLAAFIPGSTVAFSVLPSFSKKRLNLQNNKYLIAVNLNS
jgi:hypothetical protein